MNNTVAVMMPLLDMVNIFPNYYQSLLDQTYDDWVLYVMDAKRSIEDVKGMVDRLNKGHGDRIVYYKQREDGLTGAALNELYEHIKDNGHRYYAFFCGDDHWHPNKLQIQKSVIDCFGDLNLILSNWKWSNAQTFNHFGDWTMHTVSLPRDITISNNPYMFASFFFTQAVIDARMEVTGGKLTSYGATFHVDWEFLLETRVSNIPIRKCNEILVGIGKFPSSYHMQVRSNFKGDPNSILLNQEHNDSRATIGTWMKREGYK